MSRLVRVMSGVCVLLLACSVGSQAKGNLKVMGVAGFSYQGDADLAEDFENFDETLRDLLEDSKRFQLVEAARMQEVLAGTGQGNGPLLDRHAMEVTGSLGTDYTVYGSIRKAHPIPARSGYSVSIDVKILDATLSEVSVSETVVVAEEGALTSVVRHSLVALTKKIVLGIYPITVAAKKNDVVVLNYGKDYLAKGDVLDVVAVGEAIVDPATGIALGHAEDVIGKIRVEKVSSRSSRAGILTTEGEITVGAVCVEGELPPAPAVVSAPRPARAVAAPQAPTVFGGGALDYTRLDGTMKGQGKLRVAVGDFVYGAELNLSQGVDRSRKVKTQGMTGNGGLLGFLGTALLGDPNDGDSANKISPDSDTGNTELSKKSRVMREMIVTRLAKTRQCDVLERSRLSEITREVDLIRSGAQGLFEKSKLSQVKLQGADYLVYGTITKLSERVKNSTKIIHSRNTTYFEMTMDIRIVDLNTGRVITSEEVTASSELTKHNSNVFGIAGSGSEEGGGVAKLLTGCADQIAIKVVTSLRPMVILDVNPETSELMVNYGSGMIDVGESFDVYSQGRVLRDPYSGLVSGKVESLIGTITAMRVGERVCLMTPNGKKVDSSIFEAGMICRPAIKKKSWRD